MKKDSELRDDIKRVETDRECYQIGNYGITKIKEAQRYGEFCMITYYEIYQNEKHWIDVHSFREVEYL